MKVLKVLCGASAHVEAHLRHLYLELEIHFLEVETERGLFSSCCYIVLLSSVSMCTAEACTRFFDGQSVILDCKLPSKKTTTTHLLHFLLLLTAIRFGGR